MVELVDIVRNCNQLLFDAESNPEGSGCCAGDKCVHGRILPPAERRAELRRWRLILRIRFHCYNNRWVRRNHVGDRGYFLIQHDRETPQFLPSARSHGRDLRVTRVAVLAQRFHCGIEHWK